MEIEDLENRIKEIDMSIFKMKELIQTTTKESELYIQKKNDEISRTNVAIFKNEGRKEELEKLVVELKAEGEIPDE